MCDDEDFDGDHLEEEDDLDLDDVPEEELEEFLVEEEDTEEESIDEVYDDIMEQIDSVEDFFVNNTELHNEEHERMLATRLRELADSLTNREIIDSEEEEV